MLTVETIRKIRLAARDGKQSIRQITKDFNVSRNTVRKVLRSDQTHFEYHRDTVHRPKLGPFIDTLTTLLKHDQPLPLKQRRTAQGYYEALPAEGYRGAYDSVRRFVKNWRAEHQGSPTDAYIPLVFEPGEAFQFDWSHEKIVIAGAMTDVKIAHIRLCHSRLFLTVAYLRESQEMVFDAHRRAFEFFGGVTRRGIYDNMKTAVCRILRGKERDFNRRFEELASHYLFEPVACTPVDILACVPGDGLDAVADACNEALSNGSVSRDVIINLLARQHEEASPEIVTIPAHLELNEPPVADCARYDRFRKEVVHVA